MLIDRSIIDSRCFNRPGPGSHPALDFLDIANVMMGQATGRMPNPSLPAVASVARRFARQPEAAC
jgi:hypothetical protein